MRGMRNGPVKPALLLLIALAGCRGGEGERRANGAAPADGGEVQTATLTGLYEGGEGPRRNQLCVVERDGRGTFGFVAWGEGERSCSASGSATREGSTLRLRLDGDESCTLDARIDGRRVTFPPNVAAECARYYCGDGVQMTGITFDKVGGEEADARGAADLVGDPLCDS